MKQMQDFLNLFINLVIKSYILKTYKFEVSRIMKFFHLKDKKFPFFHRFIQRENLNKHAIIMGAILQKQKCREGNEQSGVRIQREKNIEKYFRPSCFPVLNNRFN